MDKILINDLKVYAYHGLLPEEKSLGQFFIVSVELSGDFQAAGFSDSIEGTINYAEVCHFINGYMQENNYDLIEAVAENLARQLLLCFSPQLKEVTVSIKKPGAPIGLVLENAQVVIHRKWHTAILALGSNMGEREKYINDALEFIDNDELCRVVRMASLYETKPYGKTDQEDFMNTACCIETLMDPEQLLKLCHEAEEAAGRVRKERWGPRTLDVDIIFYEDIILNEKEPWLEIPHADMHNRSFVLEPVNEIAPAYIHPIYGESVRVLYERLKAKEESQGV